MNQDPNPPLKNDDELENDLPLRTDVQRFESLIEDSRELPDLKKVSRENPPPSFEEILKISREIPATLNLENVQETLEDAIANTAELIDGILATKPETWADKTAALEEALGKMKLVKAPTPTHMINLSVTVDNEGDWQEIFSALSDLVQTHGRDYPSMTVSSHLLDEEDDEAVSYDERTLSKVWAGLREAGITGDLLNDCVNQMQNQGILFRERT